MTALAMILGMLPMALALGSGSEQNAPLGRAVIGGLFAATLMTLFVVPAVYSIFSRNLSANINETHVSTRSRCREHRTMESEKRTQGRIEPVSQAGMDHRGDCGFSRLRRLRFRSPGATPGSG